MDLVTLTDHDSIEGGLLLLDRPDLPPMRVGEPASESVWPGVANAVSDAIGVRLRQLPLTPARVLAGLAGNA